MPEIFKLIPPVWIGCTALIAILFSAIAFAGGIVFGFIGFSYAARIEIRKRLERGRYADRELNWLSECRAEDRKDMTNQTLVSVRAPILDSAGIPTASEEDIFTGTLLNISRKGAAILASHFVPVDNNVQIACNDKNLSFPYRLCKVRSVLLTSKGLRIGVEFFKIGAVKDTLGNDNQQT